MGFRVFRFQGEIGVADLAVQGDGGGDVVMADISKTSCIGVLLMGELVGNYVEKIRREGRETERETDRGTEPDQMIYWTLGELIDF